MRSKRTPLLLAVAAVLLAANLWWFMHGTASDGPDFVLAARTETVRLSGASIAKQPVYEPRADAWTSMGSPVTSLHGFLRPDNGGASTPYLPVVLSKQAGTRDFQAMLTSLVERGICSFALVQPAGNPQEIAATVQHIVSVRDANGSVKQCKASTAA